jgi:hypothetical protein
MSYLYMQWTGLGSSITVDNNFNINTMTDRWTLLTIQLYEYDASGKIAIDMYYNTTKIWTYNTNLILNTMKRYRIEFGGCSLYGGAAGNAAASPAAQVATGSSGVGGAAGNSAASPAASSGVVATAPKQEFRAYMQIYTFGVDFDCTAPEDAWMFIDVPHIQVKNGMDFGANLVFFPDEWFTIFPYGAQTMNVFDSDMCGSGAMSPGQCMKWRYNHMFHLWHGNIRKAFIVMKMPVDDPSINETSWEIEQKVRAMFMVTGPMQSNTPCWLGGSIADRTGEFWKAMYEKKCDEQNQTKKEKDELKAQVTVIERNASNLERTVLKLNSFVKDIKITLECPQCMSFFDANKHCMVSSCGHLLCHECHAKNVERKSGDKCGQCNKTNAAWFKFFGMTFIAEAVQNVD